MTINLAGIDLNLLVVLDALITEQSVTRAAEKIGRTQPAVSNALGRLRALLDDDLLVRDGRNMRLTEQAQSLQGPLNQTLKSIRRTLEHRAKFDPSEDQFTIRLFASDYVSFLLLPPLLRELKRQAPKADLIVLWSKKHRVFNQLESADLDLAIGNFNDLPKGVRRRHILDENPVVVGRQDHPAFDEEPMTLEAFLGARHLSISYEGLPFDYVDQAVARLGVSYRSDVVIPHFLAVPFIVKQTDLLAMVSQRLADYFSEKEGLAWRKPPFDIASLPIDLIWSELTDTDAAISWFRSLVIDVAASLKVQSAKDFNALA